MKKQWAVAGVISALALAAALPARADSMQTFGPPAPEMVQIASYYAPPGTFFLANGQMQVIHFSQGEAHSLCLDPSTPSLPIHVGVKRVVPLRASWGTNNKLIYPGQCVQLDASVVAVTPDGRLHADEALRAHVARTKLADLAGS